MCSPSNQTSTFPRYGNLKNRRAGKLSIPFILLKSELEQIPLIPQENGFCSYLSKGFTLGKRVRSTKLYKKRQRNTLPFFHLPLSSSFGSLCILGVEERGQVLLLPDFFSFPEMSKYPRLHTDLSSKHTLVLCENYSPSPCTLSVEVDDGPVWLNARKAGW